MFAEAAAGSLTQQVGLRPPPPSRRRRVQPRSDSMSVRRDGLTLFVGRHNYDTPLLIGLKLCAFLRCPVDSKFSDMATGDLITGVG